MDRFRLRSGAGGVQGVVADRRLRLLSEEDASGTDMIAARAARSHSECAEAHTQLRAHSANFPATPNTESAEWAADLSMTSVVSLMHGYGDLLERYLVALVT